MPSQQERKSLSISGNTGSSTTETSMTNMSIFDDQFPTSTSPWPNLAIRDRPKRVELELDGQPPASTLVDRTARLWDSKTGESRGTLKGHSGGANADTFSPDGQLLASTSVDRTARLRDSKTGGSRGTLRGHSEGVNAVAFSPDGQLLASASWDRTVKLWDSKTGESRGTLKGHSEGVKAVVFSPDGQLLASASVDRTVRLWDSKTGESRGTLKGHSRAVDTVVFSPNGQLLASASWDRTARLWDSRTGESCGTLEGHSREINAVVFSPDGQLLASASVDRTVRLWDSRTGVLRGTLKGHLEGPNAVAFSPDGQLLASASWDRTSRLWDSKMGESRGTLKGHLEGHNAVAFSPDGQLLASAPWDRTVRLWDSRTGESRGTLKGHSVVVDAVAFSPDGQLLASASWDRTVRLWDSKTGESRRTLRGHSGGVNAVAFSPDGQLLASASVDRTVRLWDSRTGESRGALKGRSAVVNAAAFSPMELLEALTPSEDARQEFNRAVEAKSAPKEPGLSGSVTLNREQPPDSIPESDVTSELRKEVDAIHLIGSATQGDSKEGLPKVLPEETTSLAANLAGAATVTDSLAGNIGPLRSGSFEPMRRRGMSEPLKTPFTRLDQAEARVRDVDPVEVATIGGGTMSNSSPETQEWFSSRLDTPLSGITSSQESTDSMDSDLLSVSESSEETESLESLDQNEAFFPILREALDQLLRGFGAIKKAVNGHQPSSGKSNQASVASAADSSTPNQSSNTGLGWKRRRTEEGEEQDQADAALSRRVRKKLKPGIAQPRFLACPYWKRNPNKHRRCCKLTLKRIRDVKQHLHRRHTPEFYCERCFVIFPNDQSHQDHIVSALCRREPHAQLDGISHSQHRELCRKSNPAFTEENQWFAIWDILFPGSERPFSAYIDSELSEDLCLFREHWQNSGQDVLWDVLRSNQWVSMSAEERETQGRSILAGGLDRIYEDWLSSRSPVTTESQPAASSASYSRGIARTGSTRSSETLATSVAGVQLGPPTQASGAEMLENDLNDVSDSAGEETALLGSGELENTGLTTNNGVEVADLPGFPQPFQESNIDESLASGWEELPGVMDPRGYFWL